MKVLDIKQIQVSAMKTATTNVSSAVIDIKTALDVCKSLKPQIEYYRSLVVIKNADKKQLSEVKLNYPCWMPTGVFKNGLKDENITAYSNIVAIDIDAHEGESLDIDKIKDLLMELPYVFVVSKSISGNGVYALILVEDGRYTKQYCQYIERLWKQEYNIEIDKKCYNIARKRFFSYDEDMRIKDDNTDIIPFNLKYEEKEEEPTKEYEIKSLSKYNWGNGSNNIDIEFTRKVDLLIKYNFDIGPHWGDWASFGRCFKPFDNGYDLFNKISQTMSAYNSKRFSHDWQRIRNDFDKEHAIAYITLLLNEYCNGWKDDYYHKQLI